MISCRSKAFRQNERKKIEGREGEIKTAHEIIGPEEGAVPMRVKGHDQIKGQEG